MLPDHTKVVKYSKICELSDGVKYIYLGPLFGPLGCPEALWDAKKWRRWYFFKDLKAEMRLEVCLRVFFNHNHWGAHFQMNIWASIWASELLWVNKVGFFPLIFTWRCNFQLEIETFGGSIKRPKYGGSKFIISLFTGTKNRVSTYLR